MLISDFLDNITSLVISGHVNPDGDCVGSALAIYGYIKNNYPGITVDVYLEKPTDKLSFLKYYDDIKTDLNCDISYDLMICVDCASKERLGGFVRYFNTASRTVNIDHHVSNPQYADENIVSGGLSSCSELLYTLMEPDRIDRDIAMALYTGIIYDTGVFKYDATTPRTMRIAADLLEFGLDTNFIVDESFYAKTYNENRILGYALEKSTLTCNGKLIYSSITNEDLARFKVSNSELEGIVEQLRLTKDVHVALFVRETERSGEYKISLRSDSHCDVNKIAELFGGGGHVRAAGANYCGDLNNCINEFVNAAERFID